MTLHEATWRISIGDAKRCIELYGATWRCMEMHGTAWRYMEVKHGNMESGVWKVAAWPAHIATSAHEPNFSLKTF